MRTVQVAAYAVLVWMVVYTSGTNANRISEVDRLCAERIEAIERAVEAYTDYMFRRRPVKSWDV